MISLAAAREIAKLIESLDDARFYLKGLQGEPIDEWPPVPLQSITVGFAAGDDRRMGALRLTVPLAVATLQAAETFIIARLAQLGVDAREEAST